MRFISKNMTETVNNVSLKGCIRLQLAVLSVVPELVAAQNFNRNYHDEDFGVGRGQISWKALTLMLFLIGLGLWWLTKQDEELRKKQEERREQVSAREPGSTKNQEVKDFYRRNYEATKLVYAEPKYVKIFIKYSEARRNEHLAEIAEFIDELSDIDKFFERLKAMPVEEREPFRPEAEARMGRKVELLKRVYRELD